LSSPPCIVLLFRLNQSWLLSISLVKQARNVIEADKDQKFMFR